MLGEGLGVFGFLGQGFDGGVEGAAGGFGHAVDEEGAVEVVDFVLDAAGEEFVAEEGVGLGVEVLVGDFDGVGAGDVAADVGEGEAAFLDDVVVGFEDGDFGVDENEGHEEVEGEGAVVEEPLGVFGEFFDFDDAELDGLADLLGGEADAAGGVHGFEHVGGELFEGGGEFGDVGAFLAEDGVVVVADGKWRHCEKIKN